jgi:hypothetical protein
MRRKRAHDDDDGPGSSLEAIIKKVKLGTSAGELRLARDLRELEGDVTEGRLLIAVLGPTSLEVTVVEAGASVVLTLSAEKYYPHVPPRLVCRAVAYGGGGGEGPTWRASRTEGRAGEEAAIAMDAGPTSLPGGTQGREGGENGEDALCALTNGLTPATSPQWGGRPPRSTWGQALALTASVVPSQPAPPGSLLVPGLPIPLPMLQMGVWRPTVCVKDVLEAVRGELTRQTGGMET